LAVDARDVDLAVEPPRDGPDARVLLSLSDDSLHVIFANLPLPAVAAFAGVCKHTATLSCAENLWQRLMQARWPGVAPAEDGRWRVLHRERAMLPRWQYLWSCMDAIEQLLADRAPAWPAKFAGHLIRMGAGPVPHGAAAYDAWGERVRGALAPMALRELVRWLSQLSQGLDIYYDVQEQGAPRGAQHQALSGALLSALRGLSGLWQLMAGNTLHQLSGGQQVLGTTRLPFHRSWDAAGLPEAMRKLEGDLDSLWYEGFQVCAACTLRLYIRQRGSVCMHTRSAYTAYRPVLVRGLQVSVAPALRPPGTPRSHAWWFYTPSGWMGERC